GRSPAINGWRRCICAADNLGENGVTQNLEILDPESAGLLRRSAAVEIDLEPHCSIQHVRIETDEFEDLTGVTGPRQQLPPAGSAVPHFDLEWPAAAQRSISLQICQL